MFASCITVLGSRSVLVWHDSLKEDFWKSSDEDGYTGHGARFENRGWLPRPAPGRPPEVELAVNQAWLIDNQSSLVG